MRRIAVVGFGLILTCGLSPLPTPSWVRAQEPEPYMAVLASHEGGPAPGTGDLTVMRVTPVEAIISGSIATTGRSVELAAAPNGEYVIALNQQPFASVITGFDRGQPEETQIFTVGAGANALAITPDSSMAVILNGQDNPPTAMIVDGLPETPRLRSRIAIPGAFPGTELDIALLDSGNSAAISAGCAGLSVLDGIQTETPRFRPGSPFTFTGCIQGLAAAPDGTALFTASLLSGMGFSVLRIRGVEPGDTPVLTETSPIQPSTLSNLRMTPDGSKMVVPGFQGIFVYQNTEMGIQPPRLIQITGSWRAARQGGAAISPDGHLALVANIDVDSRTTLSVISDLVTDVPVETAQVEPSEMVTTLPGAQQSIVFVPPVAAPSFFPEEEPNNSLEQANSIMPETTILGSFDPAGDVDFFSFRAEANERIEIETRAQRLDPPSAADTVLTLFDSEGNAVTENDDDGNSFDSRAEFLSPASGRYFFRVRESRDKGGTNFNYEVVLRLNPN